MQQPHQVPQAHQQQQHQQQQNAHHHAAAAQQMQQLLQGTGNSLLHGILTKQHNQQQQQQQQNQQAQSQNARTKQQQQQQQLQQGATNGSGGGGAGAGSGFSPTLARLLTAPERISTVQNYQQQPQQQQMQHQTPVMNLSKNLKSEITITPVVSQHNSNNAMNSQYNNMVGARGRR